MTIANEIERLAELHRNGTLSDAEFASAKARALADAPLPASSDAVRWLHRLRRSRSNAWLGGVCGGLALSTSLPAWLCRLIFVLFAVCGGTGFVMYLLLWILVPKDDGVIEMGTSSARPT